MNAATPTGVLCNLPCPHTLCRLHSTRTRTMCMSILQLAWRHHTPGIHILQLAWHRHGDPPPPPFVFGRLVLRIHARRVHAYFACLSCMPILQLAWLGHRTRPLPQELLLNKIKIDIDIASPLCTGMSRSRLGRAQACA